MPTDSVDMQMDAFMVSDSHPTEAPVANGENQQIDTEQILDSESPVNLDEEIVQQPTAVQPTESKCCFKKLAAAAKKYLSELKQEQVTTGIMISGAVIVLLTVVSLARSKN